MLVPGTQATHLVRNGFHRGLARLFAIVPQSLNQVLFSEFLTAVG
jgi:hypothetical protein